MRNPSKKKRVLFVANTSWYLWNFRVRLAEKLISNGYEVGFCAPVDDYSERLTAYGRFVALCIDRKGRNPFREMLAMLHMSRRIRSFKPDVILTWTPKANIYGGLLGRLLRIPVIPNVSGLGFAFIRGGILEFVVRVLYRGAFASSRIVFFQNDHDRRLFVGKGIVQERVAHLLPGSGVNLQRFHPGPMPCAEKFIFLFVGRLLTDKGIGELVDAIRILLREGRQIELRVAGFLDPGNPSALEEQTLNLWMDEGVLTYLGRTEKTEDLIHGADCVVLPSYREGMPRIVLEASACACPVIVSDVPGCRDAVVDGVTGFLCKPQDPISLAHVMRKMSKLSVPEREAMGTAGRNYMERVFSEDVVFDAYLKAVKA